MSETITEIDVNGVDRTPRANKKHRLRQMVIGIDGYERKFVALTIRRIFLLDCVKVMN